MVPVLGMSAGMQAETVPGTRSIGEASSAPTGAIDGLRPGGQDDKSKPANATVINALKRTRWDPKQNKVVFQGSVQVDDPRFMLRCDALTAHLKKNVAGPSKRSAAGAEGPAEKSPQAAVSAKGMARDADSRVKISEDDGRSSGALESAEAEGNVEIIQERVTPEGKTERNVVRAQRAVYDSSTESITLTGWPQVWQSHSGNSLRALSEETIMVLNKSGDVDINGPIKSVFISPSKNGK